MSSWCVIVALDLCHWFSRKSIVKSKDPLKQAQGVIFSWTRNKAEIVFNGNPVTKSFYQKHLRMSLDGKLDFDEHT